MIIEAKDFAGKPTQGFCFGGGDPDAVIAGLQKLIDAIKDKKVLLQGVTLLTSVELQEFTMTTFSIRYAERDDRPVLKELYGNLRSPVDVAVAP